jgi:hypothetical protein
MDAALADAAQDLTGQAKIKKVTKVTPNAILSVFCRIRRALRANLNEVIDFKEPTIRPSWQKCRV